MNKIFDFLEKHLMEPMGTIANFQIVRAITAAGMASVPFTIVGSLFLVLNIIPKAFPFLTSIWEASFFKFSSLYMMANTFTMGILTIYFTLIVGYELTKIKADEQEIKLDPLNGAMLSMLAFFLTVPEMVFENGKFALLTSITETEKVINGIRMGGFVDRLGASGIFTGILMSWLAVSLYALCVRKHWTVKLPDVVPAGVSKSFTTMIPAFVITIAVMVINAVLIMCGYDIYKVVSIPFSFVANITNSWIGMMIIPFLMAALWGVGIHGANIIGAFLNPIALANMAYNVEVVAAGSGEPFAYAGGFLANFVQIGGSGQTLGLVICMVLLAKSQQLKVLGKASIVPSIFNINEPIIFGMPIIYNPYILIPFILAPVASSLIAFLTISAGWVSPIIAIAPWPTPVGIASFLSTGGDYRAAILSLVCLVVSTLIYFPFFKMYDKKLVADEEATLAAKENA